jgi:hypothetical protein
LKLNQQIGKNHPGDKGGRRLIGTVRKWQKVRPPKKKEKEKQKEKEKLTCV